MTNNNENEVVGVFDTKDKLEAALEDLSMHFPRDAFSVLASENSLQEHIGEAHPTTKQALNNRNTPTEAPTSPESETILSGGVIGVTSYVGAVGAALAMGAAALPVTIAVSVAAGLSAGAASSVLIKIFGDRYDESLEKQINAGGLMLWVRALGKDKINTARTILIKHGAENVEIF